MELVYSPWTNEFERLIRSARRRLYIAAPYFSERVLQRIVEGRRRGVEVDFLLSLSRREVQAGVQSATAVRELRGTSNCRVRLARNLHAKFLISDGRQAIVTSSNLTQGGLSGNVELGVYVDDAAVARGLAGRFDQWFAGASRIPPSAELDKLCRLERTVAKQGDGLDYGALIAVRNERRPTSPNEQSQGWILVHSEAEYPVGTVENPEMEMKRYGWRPVEWKWRHGRYGLKQDGCWRTILLAWDGKVFCEAKAMVGRPPRPPYNVRFKITDCRKHRKVSLSELGAAPQHRGLIRLTTTMLEKYYRLVGCSVDR